MKNNVPILFSSRFISDLGSAIFKFALSLYILDVTGSPAVYSLILTLSMLPGILISIVVGTIIDRYDKKKIIFWADIISGICVLMLFLVLELIVDSVAILGISVVVVSIVQSFLNLGINASLGNIVEEDMVPKVNSFFQGLGAIITILGPVISAFLYHLISIKWIMFIDGISYFIGAILTSLLVFKYNQKAEDEVAPNKLMEDVKAVFSYIKEAKYIKFFMVMLASLTFVYSPLTMVAIQQVMRITVKGTEFQLSLILAALGIGVVVGAVLIIFAKNTNDVLKKLVPLCTVLTISIGMWLIPLNMLKENSNLWHITLAFVGILFAMGVVYTLIIIPTYTYLQLEVPENMRGRIFGIATTALSIFGPLGVVIYGQLLEYFKPSVTVVFSMVIILITIVFSMVSKEYKTFKKSINL